MLFQDPPEADISVTKVCFEKYIFKNLDKFPRFFKKKEKNFLKKNEKKFFKKNEKKFFFSCLGVRGVIGIRYVGAERRHNESRYGRGKEKKGRGIGLRSVGT